jgi:tellurite resistance protein TerC
MKYQQAVAWSAFWVISALLFSVGILRFQGIDAASTFLTAYTVEKMLSFDNLFMFYIIFDYMGLKQAKSIQRIALNWGFLGAIVLRGTFIFSGCFLVNQFSWLLYLFAGFLAFTSLNLLISNSEDDAPPAFILKIKQKWPSISVLLLAIIVIEITDIVFAIDSIPAILSITQDNFLVYSSNLFAILGLRSMYFVLLGLIKRFCYLQQCVAFILAFISAKIFIHHWVAIDPITSLAIIMSILIMGITLSSTKEQS